MVCAAWQRPPPARSTPPVLLQGILAIIDFVISTLTGQSCCACGPRSHSSCESQSRLFCTTYATCVVSWSPQPRLSTTWTILTAPLFTLPKHRRTDLTIIHKAIIFCPPPSRTPSRTRILHFGTSLRVKLPYFLPTCRVLCRGYVVVVFADHFLLLGPCLSRRGLVGRPRTNSALPTVTPHGVTDKAISTLATMQVATNPFIPVRLLHTRLRPLSRLALTQPQTMRLCPQTSRVLA